MLKILIFFLLLGELERVECRSSHEINKRLGAGDRMNPFKWTLFSKKDNRVTVSVEVNQKQLGFLSLSCHSLQLTFLRNDTTHTPMHSHSKGGEFREETRFK